MWCLGIPRTLARQWSLLARPPQNFCGKCFSQSAFFSTSRIRWAPIANAPAGSDSSKVPGSADPIDFVKVEGLNAEDERRLQILQFEAEVLRQSAFQVPRHIDAEQWRKILAIPSKHARLKYYRYLFKIEMTGLNVQKKKAELAAVRKVKSMQIQKNLEENPQTIIYGLTLNTMFPYIRDSDMLAAQNLRISRARILGPPLVIDCDYDQWMTEREMVNTAKQIRDAYAYNRNSRDPFWLQLVNVKTNGATYQAMEKGIGNLGEPSSLTEISTKSYLDLFPKEKIVYLTYNAEFTLQDFNDDDIYVIGALVDRTQPKPLTMAKAKREGLRMAKLPIDIYLRWAVGNKNLTINQVVSLMCDVKLHGDWEKALSTHIPKRKLFQPEDFAAREDPNREPYHKRSPVNARRRIKLRDEAIMEMMHD